MGELIAWMSRDDVVLCVSITSIVLNLVGMALATLLDQRRQG